MATDPEKPEHSSTPEDSRSSVPLAEWQAPGVGTWDPAPPYSPRPE
ncbi:MAG: hypothetical protein ACREMN_11525 [Gemmatimonadales bacterium]